MRKKRVGLGLQIKELPRLVHGTSNTIVKWELRNAKPGEKNLRMVKKLLELEQSKE